MDKSKQRALTQWLKSQSTLAKPWLVATISIALLSGVLLIAQAALLAHLLHQLIIEQTDKFTLLPSFLALAGVVLARAACSWAKEQTGYRCGEVIRQHIRHLILNRLEALGPVSIQGRPAGSWASLILEQVEELQDFFARYLPQMAIAVLIPLVILVAVFPINWASGVIFLVTAPLVPFFMALVGIKAADANRKNFKALQRLSGYFYDRLRGLPTLKLFNRVEAEAEQLHLASHTFRQRTMEVLRLAFLSSAVLEFFTAISIAVVAVYFGFSFIGELDFGHYGASISLFTGLFVLVLAPEFYQPLRDLGTFYHAKAQAIGAAESIVEFLDAQPDTGTQGEATPDLSTVTIIAHDLEVLSPDGHVLAGPMCFSIQPGEQVALVGVSGAGKSSLLNALLGFLPYRGSLTINGYERSELDLTHWRQSISWVGQNPQLFHGSIRDNIALANPEATPETINQVMTQAYVDEFVMRLTDGLAHPVGDRNGGLSVGQAQRIAVARALLQDGALWVLDEPTASLDAHSENRVLETLSAATQAKTCVQVSHRLDSLTHSDQVWVMMDGKLVQQGPYHTLAETGPLAEMLASADRRNLDA
ncbi:cysteine/glutathione ABC transporter permease/ATP-binding protein CydD [Salinivibrio sp. HTSP]|uniref:heme ABC transporter permease/ATP-binding protein CydD n=1 Tax=Salinivibrio sp. HTSP TaxID=2115977 RepID=UPI000E31DE85|nr:cysteine/glutathione ABC transporter permease/ATP-binding protein CydD [Salinivibrio sp. HTSP]